MHQLRMVTFIAISAVLLGTGCAHRQAADVASAKERNSEGEDASSYKDMDSFRISKQKGKELKDEELEKIPTEINSDVEKWVNYFQGRGRPHMERYLARSTRYEALMKKVLRDNGLPDDLFYIALIESGFNAKAYSHASAVGYWQFIRGTGKRFGLIINQMVDERRDPVLATQAAADYFKGLYSIFGSWYLAMASYNVGENRVKREVANHKTRDFWELVRKKRLPRETMNYVPKYIAAKMIGENPEKYGFEGIDYMPPIEFDHITVQRPVNLRLMAEKMNYNYEDLKALNPKFKGEVAPLKGDDLIIRIPPDTAQLAIAAAQDSFVDKVEFVADNGDFQIYRVQRGDVIGSIARRYKTSVAFLRDINDISRRTKLKVGMKLFVPDRTPLKERKDRGAYYAKIEKKNEEEKKSNRRSQNMRSGNYYIVQSGDSLYTIAQKYNTSVGRLKKMNNIRKGRLIRVGLKLSVPGENKADSSEQKSNVDSGRKSKSLDRRLASIAEEQMKTSAKPKIHVVKRGENLAFIARRYEVSAKDIQEKNRIQNPSNIAVGERLEIPR
ncbi:MAG: LysM peptidoglycan-binding domain-containing protein [Pseudobdellovibrionaceae bacterium]